MYQLFNTEDVNVIGGGSWATTLSILLGRSGVNVQMFLRNEQVISELRSRRENLQYLPGFILPKNISSSLFQELNNEKDSSKLYVIASPVSAIYDVIKYIPKDSRYFIVASKGIHFDRELFVSDIIKEHFPNAKIAVLSGPNIAKEILQGSPTASVIASDDEVFSEKLSNIFHSRYFRIYTSTDPIGVQVGGAMKNVYAIAAGFSDGVGFGQNTKSALLTRGINEMAQVGMKMGAKFETFFGISGIGDLMVTGNSTLSRNYSVGYSLSKGGRIQEIIKKLGQVAEGVNTSSVLTKLAFKYQVEIPIADAVYGVVSGKISSQRAIETLMERSPKQELIKIKN